MTGATQIIRLYAALVACSCILTVFYTWLLVENTDLTVPFYSKTKNIAQYSFEQDNFPFDLPFELGSAVEMAVEESVHYSLFGPGSTEEWMHHSPYGYGVARLGPANRTFYLSMFHQIHCLDYFRDDLTRPGGRGIRWGHTKHCMNVLREAILCHADLTLEPGDFATRAFTYDRQGAVHTCRNWNTVFEYTTRVWGEWSEYISNNNITGTHDVHSVEA
ncbi:hypothetical protein BV25DRAFT_1478851 [Artomyces pyxidatus]|uniref:Uncharacterized protein n=1 Tax=Artomyces pyxidatus TaxID=48021 RepID=A0ACB8SLF7_9AGAM|nr:hypothetical protein BV25DRAFT_1478851 [Artomyces pyxidatus]